MIASDTAMGVPYCPILSDRPLEEVAVILEQLSTEPLGCSPWPQYVADVKVLFAIAHSGDTIFLKYNVKEEQLRAQATLNGNIHEDSCVEFFLAWQGDANYYNLEFNCLGTAKIGYGSDRTTRILLDETVVRMVDYQAVIRSAGEWELLLAIPVTVFVYHDIAGFSGLTAKGNFYKCGDLLPHPHYLSWRMINAPEPDFHCPADFGSLYFKI